MGSSKKERGKVARVGVRLVADRLLWRLRKTLLVLEREGARAEYGKWLERELGWLREEAGMVGRGEVEGTIVTMPGMRFEIAMGKRRGEGGCMKAIKKLDHLPDEVKVSTAGWCEGEQVHPLPHVAEAIVESIKKDGLDGGSDIPEECELVVEGYATNPRLLIARYYAEKGGQKFKRVSLWRSFSRNLRPGMSFACRRTNGGGNPIYTVV
jgi:hypothetical protein